MTGKSLITARDVTGLIDVGDPEAVCTSVLQLLLKRYPQIDVNTVTQLYRDFARLYRGQYPGFVACETPYHDMQHVLDVSLAMARLLDGYDKQRPLAEPLSEELAVLGLAIALFHDAGYIRQQDDTERSHGAEYTKVHVTRSAKFLAAYLPTIGLGKWSQASTALVHFTGYEIHPDDIQLDDKALRILGEMIGTADVLAQMADREYLSKCRDRLYPEFALGGMLATIATDGTETIHYRSALELLEKTPEFIKQTIETRLEGHFHGLYHCLNLHFSGENLYLRALDKNRSYLESLLACNDEKLLTASLSPFE